MANAPHRAHEVQRRDSSENVKARHVAADGGRCNDVGGNSSTRHPHTQTKFTFRDKASGVDEVKNGRHVICWARRMEFRYTLRKTICAGALVIGAIGACKAPTVPTVNAVGRVEGPTMLSVGDVVVYTGTITFSDGVDRPGSAKTWASSNQAVATIDGSGRLTARSAGLTIVSVSAPGSGGGTSTPGTLSVQVH
jgi:hypothetical protein